jgi:hypothetical protein
MATASTGSMVLGAAGAALLVITLVDVFVTVFNYDGFRFVASRMHRLLWSGVRALSRPLPDRARHATLSIGAASMLPATYVLWLALEVLAFAMIYYPGLVGGQFALDHVRAGFGSALYLSAGALSSLTFGDIVPRSGLYKAVVDAQTIVGLTTFTLALGYVVTTFGVLRTLDSLHATVRRHAEDPVHPSSILARHFRGGDPSELPDLLRSLAEKLEEYDQGLRRYPVVYYFHTRRLDRSIPRVFGRLGDLIALVRWGLPADQSLTRDPLLAALHDEYLATLKRLQLNFVGPPQLDQPEPVAQEAFESGDEPGVRRFRELQRTAQDAAGVEPAGEDEPRASYEQYRAWLPFAHRQRKVLERVAATLGYAYPE